MAESVADSWEKFLNPESLKQNLLGGGLYLAAFEMLKQSLESKPKEFFCEGFDEKGDIINPRYKTEVSDLHKNSFRAAILWFIKMGALNQVDYDQLILIRDHRNLIAHEFPKIITSANYSVNMQLLKESHRILHKVDNWWIVNVEIPTNPDFDNTELSEENLSQATSLSSLLLSFILPLAAGDDEKMQELYEQWKYIKS